LDDKKAPSFNVMETVDAIAKSVGINDTYFMDGTRFSPIKITPEMDRCQRDRMDDLSKLNSQMRRVMAMGSNAEILSLLQDQAEYKQRISDSQLKIEEIRNIYGANFPN
jgi:hypothetical protein